MKQKINKINLEIKKYFITPAIAYINILISRHLGISSNFLVGIPTS